jgi:hypothetical protein
VQFINFHCKTCIVKFKYIDVIKVNWYDKKQVKCRSQLVIEEEKCKNLEVGEAYWVELSMTHRRGSV